MSDMMKMEPELELVNPPGLTQAQKEAIAEIYSAVQTGRIDPVEIHHLDDGSLFVKSDPRREVSGVTASVKDIVNVEEWR